MAIVFLSLVASAFPQRESSPVKAASSQTGSPLQFVAVTPCRIADTRNPAGPFGGPELGAGSTREFDIPQSACSIPATAVAYSLNVTVIPIASLDYLTMWPSGQAQPLVSTLNSDGRIKANAAITPAGTNGGVSLYASDATQVILDIDGYFVPAGTASTLQFYPLTPCRVADTRGAAGPLGGPSLGAGAARAFPVTASACSIPTTAQAYSLNVTALPHAKLNYLTTWPTGEAQPNVSTLNSSTGAVTANAAIVPAGMGGNISVFVSDAADVILDVNGYFAPPSSSGLSLYTVVPCRVIDTRSGSGAFNGTLAVPVEASACAPASTAQGYVLNATVVPPAGLNYLTLWPDGEAQPLVSTLNAGDAAITSNMAIVPTSNGRIDAFSSNSTNLILDISSFFAPSNTTQAAATPTFTPPGGSYASAQTVTIGDSTPGAAIYYTSDGSTPTTSSTPYTTPIPVSSSETLQAIAVAANLSPSAVATATYAITIGPPTISGFAPTTGSIGTLITIMGSNLGAFGGTAPTVTLAQLGGGSISAPISASSSGSLTFVIPPGAATGPIEVTVGAASATTSTNLTVTPSSNFTLNVMPSPATLIEGQSTALAATISSNNGFSGVATLSITGLPAGVTAAFKPTSIAAGQVSTLTLTAPASQGPGSTPFQVTATASIDGQSVPQTVTPMLNVTAITTTFLGRTVVDDAQQEPIAGVTVSFTGKDDKGNSTGCSGQTTSDAGGNFVLSNLPTACIGPQLISYNGETATSPAGKYAGVNLSYTLVSGQVLASPVLVSLPRIDNAETVQVQQNAANDQIFYFNTIPGLQVTVYKGTTLSLDDGSQPNPFPLTAMDIPLDRLPEQIPTNGMLMGFVVAFQPANAVASQPVAVTFPNPLNVAPGTNSMLTTLDPTHGYMVPYGTTTVSGDGRTFVPDMDPAHPGHRYGLVHFDWHSPLSALLKFLGLTPEACGITAGGPVDLSSGLETYTTTDILVRGGKGSIGIKRIYRTLSTNPGPFGIGTGSNYSLALNTVNVLDGGGVITLLKPNGNQYPLSLAPDGTYLNTTIPELRGAILSHNPNAGTYTLQLADGLLYTFQVFANVGSGGAFLTAITDLNGNTTTLTRNPSQPLQLLKVTDPVGRSLTLTYDSSNRVTQITDPIGRIVKYTYNSQGTLATFTDVAGGVTSYAYDSRNNLSSITDPNGVVTEQDTYNESFDGRVSQQVEADGGVYKFSYTLLNPNVAMSPVLQTVVTDPLGYQTTYRFDTQGFLLSAIDPTGQTRTLTHDPAHNNLVTSYSGAGASPGCGNPSYGDISFTYDQFGGKLTQTDALGKTFKYTYDQRFHKIATITDPLNNVVRISYDANGNPISLSDQDGNTTQFTYNSFGEVTAMTDPVGAKTVFAYDSYGNVASITDALGHVREFTYDAVSRPTRIANALGQVYKKTYDPMDRVISQTSPLGSVTSLSYDATGHLLSYTDARGNTTNFSYDPVGRLLSRKSPLGAVESIQYDVDSNPIQYTDRRGLVSTFQYDSLNRLVGESYSDAKVTLQYDSRSRLNGVVDSQAGQFAFEYDQAGNLLSQSEPTGTISYTRDALGRVQSKSIVGGNTFNYTYDSAGNMLTASTPSAGVTYTYDARNLPATLTRTNGIKTTYAFDAVGRVLSIADNSGATVLNTEAYSYDAAGRRSTTGSGIAQALTTQSASGVMDKANELTKNGGTSYTYDANGNRLEETGANGTLTYAWDGRNRLSSISDGKGNAVAIHYDFERNMLGIDRTSGTAVANQSFLIDDATNIVSLTDAGGGISSILTGGSLGSHYAAVDSSGAVVFGSEDALGSTTAVTDSTGKPVAELNYEPFGQTTGTQSEGYPFGFIGRFPILGNVEYLQNRFFDAGVGRFLSEDPAGLQLGQDNLYRYAQNNPVQNADPTGLISGGVSYGGQAEIGDGNQGDGVAGQIGGGAGLFYNSNTGEWSVGGYGSGGGVIMSPDGPSFSAPDQAVPPFVFGASIAEPGLGGWISNADDPSDLRGTFCAFNVTVFDVSLSLQVGYSNGRMIAILSGSPGEGLSVSRYTTNTFATIGANPWAEGPIVFHGTYDAGQWHGAYEF